MEHRCAHISAILACTSNVRVHRTDRRLRLSGWNAPSHAKLTANIETFVCQHIVQTLHDGVARGFFWARDADTDRPDAWCLVCNARVAGCAGEWTDDALELAKVSLLCGRCYDRAKSINFPTESVAKEPFR